MAPPCRCCTHPRRVELDATLIAGSSIGTVAATFGLTRSAVQRHATNHLPASIHARAVEALATASRIPARAIQIEETAPHAAPCVETEAPPTATVNNLDPYALACELQSSALTILREAQSAGDAKLALQANATAIGVLDRLARLMPGATSSVAVAQSAEWAQLRTAILDALRPFPDARFAVAAALIRTGGLE